MKTFKYYNGTEVVEEDVYVLLDRLIQSFREGFGITPFLDGGLTEEEVIQLVIAFLDCVHTPALGGADAD